MADMNDRRIDQLEAFLLDIVRPRKLEPSTEVVPQVQRAPAG
jgi:hypothetical protein